MISRAVSRLRELLGRGKKGEEGTGRKGKRGGRRGSKPVNPLLLVALLLVLAFRFLWPGISALMEEKATLEGEIATLRNLPDPLLLGREKASLERAEAELREALRSKASFTEPSQGYDTLVRIGLQAGIGEFSLQAPNSTPSPSPLLQQHTIALTLSGPPQRVAEFLTLSEEAGFRLAQVQISPLYDEGRGGVQLRVQLNLVFYTQTGR